MQFYFIGNEWSINFFKKNTRKPLQIQEKAVLLSRVSPKRPAPFELPQGLIAARV